MFVSMHIEVCATRVFILLEKHKVEEQKKKTEKQPSISVLSSACLSVPIFPSISLPFWHPVCHAGAVPSHQSHIA